MGNAVKDYNSVENESSSDRYYALGATYANGPLNLYLAVDSINYATYNGKGNTTSDVDDSLTVTLGGNFDFEVVKLFAGAQYFDEIETKNLKGLIGTDGVLGSTFASKMEGWGIGVSALIPAGPGAVLVGAGYMDAQAADSDSTDYDSDEMQRWVVSAGYDYVLSKRTDIYVAATYMQDNISYTRSGAADQDASVFGAMVGLRHKF
jgi:predicted porin